MTAIAVTMLAAVTGALWADRSDTWERATIAADNLLTGVSGDIARTLHVYDLSLRGVVDGLNDPNLTRLAPPLRNRLLFDRATSAEYQGLLLVIDPQGRVIYESDAEQARPGNFSDRDYFTVHRDDPDVELYVSEPFVSRISGDRVLGLSRRLNKPDGSFAGVVVGTLRLSYFDQRFGRLSLGPASTILLFRSDGQVLAQRPADADDTPPAWTGELLDQYAQGRFAGKSGESDAGGVRRLYSFRQIADTRLTLAVGLSVSEVLAPWLRKTLVLAPVTLLLCAGVVGLTFLFQREMRRRREVEAELERLANTDGLTGLMNRRTFDATLLHEWRNARREQAPLSLAFLDVDHFKAYNDRYGHPAGDEVLRWLASVLRRGAARPRDRIARYGGEEFVILLPGTDAAGAYALAEKIRQTVQALAVAHEGNPSGAQTVSIGLASVVPAGAMVPGDLIAQADAALYRAKQAGRNRVVSYAEEALLARA